MKRILIIDSCVSCPDRCSYGISTYFCNRMGENYGLLYSSTIPDWCPLPEAPQEDIEPKTNTQHLQAEIRAISDIIEVSESGLVTVDFAELKRRLRELSAVQ